MLYSKSSAGKTVQETAKSARVFRFGVFEVDAATGELRKQGLRIRLQEQPSQLLLMLLERAGEVVGREEICRKLWPPDTFVDFDQSLGTALRKLRQALSDDAETPHYIETIPKHGFRFVAPVERISATNSPPSPETKPEPHRPLGVPILWWAAFAATCVLSLFLGWMMYTRQSAGDGQQSHAPNPLVHPATIRLVLRTQQFLGFSRRYATCLCGLRPRGE